VILMMKKFLTGPVRLAACRLLTVPPSAGVITRQWYVSTAVTAPATRAADMTRYQIVREDGKLYVEKQTTPQHTWKRVKECVFDYDFCESRYYDRTWRYVWTAKLWIKKQVKEEAACIARQGRKVLWGPYP
jgi:hypothetical protein